ncbi:hypothetical protein [Nitrosomonas mobilis]|uniref:hypothetical protein n=1 Tax=Nitrosomonas mobilis TaxID=51642 RepID=UPI001C40A4AA|nr:hypothetical protein [Nitrosomonas mobilis]
MVLNEVGTDIGFLLDKKPWFGLCFAVLLFCYRKHKNHFPRPAVSARYGRAFTSIFDNVLGHSIFW